MNLTKNLTIAFLLAFLSVSVGVSQSAALMPSPKVTILDSNGDPLSGGHCHTYETGTVTPLATYTDATAGTANANPVVLDAAGRADIWLGTTGAYTIDCDDSSNANVWSVDGVQHVGLLLKQDLASTSDNAKGDALVGYIHTGTGATARTVHARMLDFAISVKDFGALGDGANDDTAEIQAAIDAIGTAGGSVYFPPGVYLVSDEIDIDQAYGVCLVGPAGRRSANAFADNVASIQISANITGSVFHFGKVSTNISKGSCIRDLTIDGDGRTYTTDAAIEVEYVDFFHLDNVHIVQVQGRGLWTQRMVKGKIRALDIAESGAASMPCLDVDDVDSSDFTQGSFFEAISVEVCYSDDYIEVSDDSKANHFIGVNLETDNAISATEQTYINVHGDRNQFTNVRMGKNGSTTAPRILIEAGAALNTFTNVVSTGAHGDDIFDIAGTRNTIYGGTLQASAETSKYAFNLNGSAAYNKVSGFNVDNLALVVTGASANQNTFTDLSSDTSPAIVVDDAGDENRYYGISSDNATVADSLIKLAGDRTVFSGGYLRDASSATSGIEVTGAQSQVYSNHIYTLAAASGISIQGNNGTRS